MSDDEDNGVLHAFVGDPDALRSVIGDGEDVDARDQMGRTALHYAVVDRQLESVEVLIAAGADVNAADKNGEVALHFAAREWSLPIAELLIAAGAAVDSTDARGNTPLNNAVFASRGRGELIRCLLAAGADPDRENHHGMSPRKLANTIANFPVAQFLK